MPLFEIPSSTASTLTGYLTGQLADVGTLTLLVVVAAIPATFYVIKRIIGLFPKGR